MNRLLIISLLLIAMLPVSAHAQRRNAAEIRALGENVVKIIGGDKAKLRAYCQINSLSNSVLEAIQEKNNEKAEELFERIDELEKQLGPEYHTLFNALYEADPNSEDTQEIFTMLNGLDESCPH
jgi:glutathionyl-hydroquinone reductase